MASYKDLQLQIQKLQQQAEEARAKEVAVVVAQIHSVMAQHGLELSDLQVGLPRRRKSKGKAAPQFRDPETGSTWTGRGRAPKWIEGKDRTEFAI